MNRQNYTNNLTNKNLEEEIDKLTMFNCSKNFIRPTSSRILNDNNLLKQSGIPFGVHFTPLHYLEGNSEQEIPLYSFGNKDLPRCKSPSCMAYMSKFITWINADTWTCNICHRQNILDEHLYAFKDNLFTGTYELIATPNYTERPPMPPSFVFIIDVSPTSLDSGYFISIIETIKDIFLNNLIINPDRSKFAFITYDSSVNFFKIISKAQCDIPQMLCITEEDVFLPAPDNRDKLLKLVDYLQNIYLHRQNDSLSAHKGKDSDKLLNAIEGGKLLLSKTGGKLVIFNASNSWFKSKEMNVEPGDKRYNNIPKSEMIYTTIDPNGYLQALGRNLADCLISCEIFQISINDKTYTNLLTLNEICNNCNGNFYFFKNFNIDHHYKNLFNTFRRVFTRSTGWEALCKIRLSADICLKDHYTPVLTNKLDLLILPAVDSEQTFSFTIENKENKLKQNKQENGNSYSNNTQTQEYAYIQIALLYSHYDGSRRIRVFNYILPKCNTMEEYNTYLDLQAVSTLYVKMIINNLYTCKKMDVAHKSFQSEYYENAIYNITESFQKNKTKFYFLRNYPLYISGMIKNRICCLDEITHSIDVDLSNYLRIKILKLNVDEAITHLNPKLYNLMLILPIYKNTNRALLTYDETNLLYLPALNRLSAESLVKDSIYFIDNGNVLVLFFTFNKIEFRRYILTTFFNYEEELLNAMDEKNILNMNVSNYSEDAVLYCEYKNEEEKELKEKIINMVEHIRGSKSTFQNLIFVLEGTPADKKECLIEDNFCPWFKHTYKEMARNLI